MTQELKALTFRWLHEGPGARQILRDGTIVFADGATPFGQLNTLLGRPPAAS